MYLDEIGDTLSLEPLIGNEEIKNIEIKKIFHLMTGRNAWHSTWVRQYYKKCMATESRELEYGAEKSREAGTTFQIDEIPALCLELNSGCFLATEINTAFPLKHFHPKNFLSRTNQINENSSSNKSLFIGKNLITFLEILRSNECWEIHKNDGSLFQLFAKGLRISDLEDATEKYATRISGTSGGKKNSLSWSIKTGKKSGDALEKLLLLRSP
jgi:hypothetical protein